MAVRPPAEVGSTQRAAATACSPYGDIGLYWAGRGGPSSWLGRCLTDEQPAPGGRWQPFERAAVYWSPATGARSVVGDIRAAYDRLGGPASVLRFPVADERPTPGRPGAVSDFQGGSLYWSPATGSRLVLGAIRDHWARHGGVGGWLGFPTTDERPTATGGGAVSHFEGGSVYWHPATGPRSVKGTILDHWRALGAEGSPLGFPVSDEYGVPGGARSDFTGGSMVWDAVTGTTRIEWTRALPPRYSRSAPVRAAFYYGWFPEWWPSPGSRFTPSAGRYSTRDLATVRRQIDEMRYGGMQAAIASWWGPETPVFDPLDGPATATTRSLRAGLRAAEGTPFEWGIYYEDEGYGNPTVQQLRRDLAYVRREFATHPNFLTRDGEPVVFVWAEPSDDCEMVERWRQAAPDFHVVHKIFPGLEQCLSVPDAWHQYAPAHSAIGAARPWSFSVSPGYYQFDEPAPRLARDPGVFDAAVRAMKAAATPWQLVTTYNEWGEGTPVEPGREWPSQSGYGWPLDLLNRHYGRF